VVGNELGPTLTAGRDPDNRKLVHLATANADVMSARPIGASRSCRTRQALEATPGSETTSLLLNQGGIPMSFIPASESPLFYGTLNLSASKPLQVR